MPRINFLFWNLNKQPLLPLLARLVQDRDVDILILAECEISVTELLEGINSQSRRLLTYPVNYSNRLMFLTTLPTDNFRPVRDAAGIAIRRLLLPWGGDLLLTAVHLPSKLHQSDNDQIYVCTQLARYIAEAEAQYGHTRSVIIGDLNMNPFEVGVVGADGLHAVMSRSIALRRFRTVRSEEKIYLYNPMWSYFGRQAPQPQGTYYYDKRTAVNYYWNVFDQVLLRPDLIPYFADEDLQIIDHIDDISLVMEDGRPNVKVASDHLPIYFSLDIPA